MNNPTDYQSFLDAIAAHPHDDELRQAFARWLSERGDPRGELIATQFLMEQALEEAARARTRDEVVRANERFDALEKQSAGLLAAHQAEWLGPLHGLVQSALWRKGFPAHLALPAEAFRDNAERIARLAPTVTSLELLHDGEGPPDPQSTAALCAPALERVEHLYLRGPWGDRAAQQVAASPSLGNLATLFLADAWVGPTGALALLGSDRLPRLQELNLSSNRIRAEGALLLLTLERLPPALGALILNDAGIDDAAASLLAENEILGSLRELSVLDNPLTGAGTHELLAAAALKAVVLRIDTDKLPAPARQAAEAELAAREERQQSTARR
jgi:uncharacterized protein (TIGR02996 family)